MKKILIIICSIWSITLLHAQEEMTLAKAISLALENNFQIKIADYQIEIAEQSNSWGRAGRSPIVDLNGTFANTLVNDNNPASFLQGTYYIGALEAGVSAQWILFNGGRVRLSKQSFDQLTQQQLLQKQVAINELIRAVSLAYHDVLLQQEQKAVLVANQSLSKKNYAFESIRKEFGQVNSFNLRQFENAIVLDSININQVNQDIEIAKRNLLNIINVDGYADYTYNDPLNTVLEEINLDRLKNTLAEENYTIKTLMVIFALDQLNTKIEKSNRKPVISVNGSFTASQNAFKFYADDPNTGEPFSTLLSNRLNGNITLNATWNLIDGGVSDANVQNAKIQEEINQLNILEATQQLNNQLEILVSNYNHELSSIPLIEQQAELIKKNIEVSEEQYKAGLINSVELQTVQNDLLSIGLSKISAIYRIIQIKIEIDFLVGAFTELR